MPEDPTYARKTSVERLVENQWAQDPGRRRALDVDDGWLDIVKSTHLRLIEIDPSYRLLQVKQKFGSLRYYYAASDGVSLVDAAAMRAVIADAEDEASRTCQVCGDPGRFRDVRGSMGTLCDQHFDTIA